MAASFGERTRTWLDEHPSATPLIDSSHLDGTALMSSPQRLASVRAERVLTSDPRVRRVRHGVRDQLLVMLFSAVLSVALAGLSALLLATVLEIGRS